MSECVLWLGAKNGEGYGERVIAGAKVRVHRLAYEATYGPIPEGLVIDHLCRVRACVNPEHMEAVTNGENVLRGMGPCALNARKTHCKHGHEFTPENTRWFGPDERYRRCRECDRRLAREAKERRELAA